MPNESYNFDDATYQGWTATANTDSAISVGAEGALNGSSNGVTLETVNDNIGLGAHIAKTLGLSYSDLYMRFRFKLNAAFEMDFTGGAIRFIVLSLTNINDPRGEIGLKEDGTGWYLQSQWSSTLVRISKDTEYELEIRWVRHATSGGFQMWLDGVLVDDDLTNVVDASNVTFARIANARSVGTIVAGSKIYIDEIEIAAARIGGTPVAAITSVGGDDVVLDAETSVPFVTSDFSSEISTVQLVSGTSITNATGVTSTSGTGTFNLPDVSLYATPTVGAPLSTTNNVVVARLTDA